MDPPAGEASSNMKLIGNRWSYVDSSGQSFLHNPETDSWEPASEEDLRKVAEQAVLSPQGVSVPQTRDENMQCINGVWVHRDPETYIVSRFDSESNLWVACSAPEEPGIEEKEDDSSEIDKGKGEEVETPKKSEESSKNEEKPPEEDVDELAFQLMQEDIERKKKQASGGEVSVYKDPVEGTVYEWDLNKRAWFPKVDDDFIAKYQANYGLPGPSGDATSTTNKPITDEEAGIIKETIAKELMTPEEKARLAKEQKKEKKAKKRAVQQKQKEEGWFEVEETSHTNVYVSNLPQDLTDDEYKDLMCKCGLIAQDPRDRKLKLKLYRNEDGSLKGDGRCCYIRRESVDLALQILDGYEVKGKKISVELAQFQLKGDFDPTKKKRKLTAQQKKKFKEREERLFDWRPEKMRGERPKSECTTILKNVFSPEDFLENAARLLDLEEELKQECSKYGEVKKLAIYDNNEDGVVAVTFGSPEMSDDCITMMNWRIFHGRQLQATTWDGKTKYKIAETDEDRQKRIENWDKYLDSGE